MPENAASAVSHERLANAIRFLAMDAVQGANSGHPGMPMGMADVATVLYAEHLKFDAADPSWPDRDRFVLSAGHGSMLLYALLHLTGYDGVSLGDLKQFRRIGSKTAGHPEFGHLPGIETTTGPLGQGIANAVGMAIAERLAHARHGAQLVDHFTYVIAGDGCLMEGLSHEAIDLAGHLQLGKLIVLWDDNSITIDGDTSLSTSLDQRARFVAAGWDVQRVDGHDVRAVSAAVTIARSTTAPSLIACKTKIGYGAPNKAGTADVHGAPLGPGEVAAARLHLNWPHAPFDIPDEILEAWRAIGRKGHEARRLWDQRAGAKRETFAGADIGALAPAIHKIKAAFAADEPKIATRKASEKTLDAIALAVPALIGGSADLTGSNLTRAASQKAVTREDFSGSYIHYGVREHGMAAAMNGIALHGGFIPYGGTFLVFSDYCRPSIRLSAMMKQRVIYVMTHDSIGLGEDGPTHQPIEHLASLRAIPNLHVIRPADAMETAEAWECAIGSADAPSVLCLSRQGTPALRSDASGDNKTLLGAYVLHEPEAARDATIIATGTEVALAIEAAHLLAASGIHAAVVSMPCWSFFERQPADYRARTLGSAPRLAIEAASKFGWERWVGDTGDILALDDFGASGEGADVYRHFGITAAAAVASVKDLIGRA